YNHQTGDAKLSWMGLAIETVGTIPFDVGPCTFVATTTADSTNFTVTILDDGAAGTVGTVTVTVAEKPTAKSTSPVPVLCGDVDGNGQVTAGDALDVLKAAVGLSSCEGRACDANGDGKLTPADALAVLKTALGLPVVLNCS
ncbi:MAG: dockerin type I domain-containing protein, partial [Deltaproteobacteria bacterium]